MSVSKTISTKLSLSELAAVQANMGKATNTSAFLRALILDFLNKSKDSNEHQNTRLKLDQVLNEEVEFLEEKFEKLDAQLGAITQVLNSFIGQFTKK